MDCLVNYYGFLISMMIILFSFRESCRTPIWRWWRWVWLHERRLSNYILYCWATVFHCYCEGFKNWRKVAEPKAPYSCPVIAWWRCNGIFLSPVKQSVSKSSKNLNLDNVEQLNAWGMDGEIIQINVPSENEVSELVSTSNERFKLHMGKAANLFLIIAFAWNIWFDAKKPICINLWTYFIMSKATIGF